MYHVTYARTATTRTIKTIGKNPSVTDLYLEEEAKSGSKNTHCTQTELEYSCWAKLVWWYTQHEQIDENSEFMTQKKHSSNPLQAHIQIMLEARAHVT